MARSPQTGPDATRQPSASFRIFVVDDFEPWRQRVCSTLKTRPELQVVGESADGLEAVQKACELKPDLILLDIGLPNLKSESEKRCLQQLVQYDASMLDQFPLRFF